MQEAISHCSKVCTGGTDDAGAVGAGLGAGAAEDSAAETADPDVSLRSTGGGVGFGGVTAADFGAGAGFLAGAAVFAGGVLAAGAAFAARGA